MKQPLFAVGEVVILQSVNSPESNGEYQVKDIYRPGESTDSRSGTPSEYFAYALGVKAKSGEDCWAESALRKKHQPGEQSFSELMSNLKMGQPA